MRIGSWKRESRGQQRADIQRDDIQQKLGFGEYAAWSYGVVQAYNDVYAKYLLSDEDDIQCTANKKFPDWMKCGELCIAEAVQKEAW